MATPHQNTMNHGVSVNNTTGYTGIKRVEKNNYKKWQATIRYNRKDIHLGYYDNLNDAVKARKEAEEKYFGEWSYDNSQAI